MPPIYAKLQKRTPYTGILMFACLYACVVVHLSLFPYTDWRHIGIGPFDFLFGPWIPVHQKVLWADVILNVLGYIPLGFLFLLGLSREPRTADKFWVVMGCIGLSLSLEAMQTFLPSRVPSKMDLLTNTMGGLLGVILALGIVRRRRLAPTLNHRLEHWLIKRAWIGMALLSLWFISLLPPQNPTFSTGLWLGNLFEIPGPQQQSTPFGLPLDFLLRIEALAPNFINYCFLMCAWLIGLAQTQSGSPRARLLMLLVLATVVIRMLDPLLFIPVSAWPYIGQLWLEANGLALGVAVAFALGLSLMPISPHHMARLGLLHLLGGWLITLLLPGVHDPQLGDSGSGVLTIFRTLQEAGRWISELWPILALTVLTFLSLPETRFRR